MSKHPELEEEIDIGKVYSTADHFIEKHKQSLSIGIGTVLVIVVGIFYYFNYYLPPLEKSATEDVYLAQKAFKDNQFDVAMYGTAEFMGFEEVIDTYGSTDIGNTAKFYMGISLMQIEAYQEAIEYLENYAPKDHMTRVLKEGGIGDCHSQMEEYSLAIDAYENAIDVYANDYLTPIYLKKAGLTSEKIKDYTSAVKFYTLIRDQYPYAPDSRDIDKYIAFATAKADK